MLNNRFDKGNIKDIYFTGNDSHIILLLAGIGAATIEGIGIYVIYKARNRLINYKKEHNYETNNKVKEEA